MRKKHFLLEREREREKREKTLFTSLLLSDDFDASPS